MSILQEEVNEKTISLCIKGGKITAQILKAALIKLLAEMDKKSSVGKEKKANVGKQVGRVSRACKRAVRRSRTSLSRTIISSRLTGWPGSMALIIV